MSSPHRIGTLIALVHQGRLSEAEHDARALLQAHPAAGMLWKILGVALMRQGRDAVEALRRAAELMPQDAEAHGNLGAALHDQQRWAEALPSLQRALEIQPNDVQALVDAADALRALGRARESVEFYRRALEQNPRLTEAQNNLGNAYLELGRCDAAAGCYRRALELRPHDAQIHCNLGNALRRLGLLAEAIVSSRRAIALDASLSVAHNNLALCLAASGQRDDAVASCRRALALEPAYVDALNNLGNVLRDLGDRREALSLHTQAAELDPRRADSHCSLGSVRFELGRIDEAAESFRRALALDPQSASAHVGLGAVLRMQGRTSEAEASCRAALAIDARDADALSLLGEIHADRGRFSEAEELFRRAIALDPDSPLPFCSLAMYRKMTRADAGWLEGVQVLLAKRPPLASEISLHHALGKYFDDLGQYDEAFGHYRRANELAKRHGSAYDGQKLARRVDRIMSSLDAAFLREPRAGASASERPVFVIGMPRSGTSLVEQILASHPAVFGAGEVAFWDDAFNAYYETATHSGGIDSALILRISRDYLDRSRPPTSGTLRVVDKLPANFLYAGLIHAVFPRARIIHMQRHPIDTCLSIYFQNFFKVGSYANDLGDLASYYGEYARIIEHWRAVLPARAFLEIPYEALIEDQESWSRRMLDFIGLPWDPRCLDFHRTERVVLTASRWQVRQKMNAASVGRWRHYEKYVAPLRHLR